MSVKGAKFISMEHRRTPFGYKTRRQIAQEYDISLSTFWRKLKEREIDLPKRDKSTT